MRGGWAALLLAACASNGGAGASSAPPPSAEAALVTWLAWHGASLAGAEIRSATADRPRGLFATRDLEGVHMSALRAAMRAATPLPARAPRLTRARRASGASRARHGGATRRRAHGVLLFCP
jgi:hypothetical protein